ncbi:hypothetical protein [Armatimonas sp.]
MNSLKPTKLRFLREHWVSGTVLSRPYLALLHDGDKTPILDAPRVLAAL